MQYAHIAAASWMQVTIAIYCYVVDDYRQWNNISITRNIRSETGQVNQQNCGWWLTKTIFKTKNWNVIPPCWHMPIKHFFQLWRVITSSSQATYYSAPNQNEWTWCCILQVGQIRERVEGMRGKDEFPDVAVTSKETAWVFIFQKKISTVYILAVHFPKNMTWLSVSPGQYCWKWHECGAKTSPTFCGSTWRSSSSHLRWVWWCNDLFPPPRGAEW